MSDGTPAPGLRLDRVYGMAELAAMIGWDRQRLVRHLKKLDAEVGGSLLRNVARAGRRPRWTTTLSALRAVSPQWFRDDAAVENQLQDLHEQQVRTTEVLGAATNQIAVLSKRVRELTTQTTLLEQNLRSVLDAAG